MTISPREDLGKLKQLVRVRLERDGVAAIGAATADPRQVAYLRRLGRRLADDGDLDCYFADHGDGVTMLTVYAKAARDDRRGLGWWGEPRITLSARP